MIPLITPNWPVPGHTKAYSTTRIGGVSQPPYDSLNLATYVGDDPAAVMTNQSILKEALQLPTEPVWLMQQHETLVIDAHSPITRDADGAYTNQPETICMILTADCLPILLCDDKGTEIAALHGGWRGLAKGIITQGIEKFATSPKNLFAWLGPTISQKAFEVGLDVYETFLTNFPNLSVDDTFLFQPTRENHFLFDLYEFARRELNALGVENIYGGDFCTYNDSERFYSYRRDHETGRIATLIWMDR